MKEEKRKMILFMLSHPILFLFGFYHDWRREVNFRVMTAQFISGNSNSAEYYAFLHHKKWSEYYVDKIDGLWKAAND